MFVLIACVWVCGCSFSHVENSVNNIIDNNIIWDFLLCSILCIYEYSYANSMVYIDIYSTHMLYNILYYIQYVYLD